MKKKIIIGTILYMALPACVWGNSVTGIIDSSGLGFSTIVDATSGVSVKEKVVGDLIGEINRDKAKDKQLRLENHTAYIGSSEFNTSNGNINLWQSFHTIFDIYELVYKLRLLVEGVDAENNLKNKVIELIKKNKTKPGTVNSLLSACRVYRADSDNKLVKIEDVDTAKKWLVEEGFADVLGDMLESAAWDLYVYTNGIYFNIEPIYEKLYGDKTKENKIKFRKIREEQNKDSGSKNSFGRKLKKVEPTPKEEKEKENTIDFRGGLKSSSKELTIEQVWNGENKDIKLNDSTDIEKIIDQNSLQIISQEILIASEDKLNMPTVRKLLLYCIKNKQYKKGYMEDMLKTISDDLLVEDEIRQFQQDVKEWARQVKVGQGEQSYFKTKIIAELGGVQNIGKDFGSLLKSSSADINKFIDDIISVYMRMRFRELFLLDSKQAVWLHDENLSENEKSELFVFGDIIGNENIINDYYLFLNETPEDLQQRLKNMSVGEYKLFNSTEEWSIFKRLDDAVDNYFEKGIEVEKYIALFVKRIIYCGILNRLKISPSNTNNKAVLAFIHYYFNDDKDLENKLVENIEHIITNIAKQLEDLTVETNGKTQFYKLFKIQDILTKVIESSFGKEAECSIYNSEAMKMDIKNYKSLIDIYNNKFPKYYTEISKSDESVFKRTDYYCSRLYLEEYDNGKSFSLYNGCKEITFVSDICDLADGCEYDWPYLLYEGHVYCSLWDLSKRKNSFYLTLKKKYDENRKMYSHACFSESVIGVFNKWRNFYYFINGMRDGNDEEMKTVIELYKNLNRVLVANKSEILFNYVSFCCWYTCYDTIDGVLSFVKENDVGGEAKRDYNEFCINAFEKLCELIDQFPKWGIGKPEVYFKRFTFREYFHIWKNGDFKRRLKGRTYEECAFELANIILYKKNKTDDNTISEACKNDLLKCITKSNTTISGFVEKIVDKVFADFGIEIVVDNTGEGNKLEYDAAKKELRIWCENIVQDILEKYAKYLEKLFSFVNVDEVDTIYTNAKRLRNDVARSDELMYITLHYPEEEFITKLVEVIKNYYKPDEIKTNKSNILIGRIKTISTTDNLKNNVLKEFKTMLSSKEAIQGKKDGEKKS